DGEGGQGDGAEDREYLHYFVGAIGDARQVDVERVVEQIALGLHRVEQARHMIVDIADIRLVFRVDEGAGIALKVQRSVAGVDQYAAQLDQLTLNAEDSLKHLW